MRKERAFPKKPCKFCKEPFQPTWSGNHFCCAKCQFFTYIKKSDSGCWLWTGSKVFGGYGNFVHAKKPIRAHVFSYKLHIGEIPTGLIVRHKCDIPACCNPDHLEIGTHQDNSNDKQARGRTARGFSLPITKLSEQDVVEIRYFLSKGLTKSEIGRMYGVTRMTISDIAFGRNRKLK